MDNKHGHTDEFVLQEGNCGPRRARSVSTYLADKGVTRMAWSSQSTDLNPIECVLGLLKSCLRQLPEPPRNPMHLFSTLSNMWKDIPDSFFQNLVASVPKRVAIVKKQRGRSTKY